MNFVKDFMKTIYGLIVGTIELILKFISAPFNTYFDNQHKVTKSEMMDLYEAAGYGYKGDGKGFYFLDSDSFLEEWQIEQLIRQGFKAEYGDTLVTVYARNSRPELLDQFRQSIDKHEPEWAW